MPVNPINLTLLPPEHPFKTFVWGLKHDISCDPFPDAVEFATSNRAFVSFNGVNSSARMDKFLGTMNNLGVDASVMNKRFQEKGGCCLVLYVPTPGVNLMAPITSHQEPLALPAPKAEIPGIVQEECY